MSQPDRFEAADLRCDACQSNTDIYGIMKTHDKGRWVKWSDYAALAAENERLRKLLEMYLKADPLIGEAVASAMLAAKEENRK